MFLHRWPANPFSNFKKKECKPREYDRRKRRRIAVEDWTKRIAELALFSVEQNDSEPVWLFEPNKPFTEMILTSILFKFKFKFSFIYNRLNLQVDVIGEIEPEIEPDKPTHSSIQVLSNAGPPKSFEQNDTKLQRDFDCLTKVAV